MKEVRRIVNDYLRKVAENQKIIAEGFFFFFFGFIFLINMVLGRDIGSVLFPKSKCKFFLDADIEERVKRRTLEEMGPGASEKDIDPIKFKENLETMKKRDETDKTRDVGPLIRLKDSIYIDTTNLTLDELVEKMVEIINVTNGLNFILFILFLYIYLLTYFICSFILLFYFLNILLINLIILFYVILFSFLYFFYK
jgi:hypothetical protein